MQLPSPAAVAGRTASDPLTDRLPASPASAGELLITTQGLKTAVFNMCCKYPGETVLGEAE